MIPVRPKLRNPENKADGGETRCGKGKAVVFISRRFPPSVGGIQNYCFHLFVELERHRKVYRITLGGSQIHLVWFLPWAFLCGLVLCARRGTSIVYCGDAALAPLGVVLAWLTGVRSAVTVHGLDVLYDRFFFQRMVRFFLPRFSVLICNSRATRLESVRRGAPPEKCRVIPCGIDSDASRRSLSREEARQRLSKRLGVQLEGRLLLCTVGRLIPRKGVRDFVAEVLPILSAEVCYVIVGDGPEAGAIGAAIRESGQEHRVFVLGKVPAELRDMVYDAADVFVLPNRRVPGDMEGFGIVSLEAAMHDLPVVASDIEGIPDAIIEGITGILVPEANPESLARAIGQAEKMDRSGIATAASEKFDWKKLYLEIHEALEFAVQDAK